MASGGKCSERRLQASNPSKRNRCNKSTSDINTSAIPDRAPLAYRAYKWLVIIPFLVVSTTLIGLIVAALPYPGAPDFAFQADKFGFYCVDFNSGV
jgi:hypothetical protein